MTSSQVQVNETPPMSAQDMESLRDEQGLIAGKFKTVEDMVASYKELEGKLGGVQDTQTEEVAEETEEATQEDWNPSEIYGEGLASVLEQAGIDTREISQTFENTGEITEEHYTKLEGAGFSRRVIDTFLGNQKDAATATEEIQQTQLDDIKSVVGGDEGYAKLRDWTQKNIPDESLKAFDKILDTQDPTMIKIAVEGFAAKMRQAEGYEPNLINGRSPQGVTPFKTGKEIEAAMGDPRYGKDEAYTLSVYKRLEESTVV